MPTACRLQAVFLDRDGTIGGTGYFIHPKDFQPYPCTEKAIRLLHAAGVKVFGFTNQTHIARGEVDRDEVVREFEALGCDGAYICPHLPEDQCDCRKPLPGLLLRAAREHDLDLTRTAVIGDTGATDMVAAHAVGAIKVLVRTGLGEGSLDEFRHTWAGVEPDFVAADLLDAVEWLIASTNDTGVAPMHAVGPMWLSAEKAVIEPKTFARELGVGLAVLSFARCVYLPLLEAFGLSEGRIAPLLPGAEEGRMDADVVLYHSRFGAPAAGMLMEALIASGVGRVIMVGQAGSLSPQCRIGDVVLPTWGVREEGTSYHYLPPGASCHPSPALLAEVKAALRALEPREGGVWSIDAPCRETRDKVERYAREGVLAVEMECTALMSIATYRGVEFAAALLITDELFGEGWVEGFRNERLATTLRALCSALPRVLGRQAPPAAQASGEDSALPGAGEGCAVPGTAEGATVAGAGRGAAVPGAEDATVQGFGDGAAVPLAGEAQS